MKYIYILVFIILASCASRKVAIVKEETKTKTDSVATIKTDSVSVTKNNIKTTENYSELEICPLNDSLPIVIDGTSYFNVVLKYKKQNKVIVDTSIKKVSKNVLKQVSKSKAEIKNIKNKTIDKKVNNFVYLWLLLIPIGMYLYRQLKNKILL